LALLMVLTFAGSGVAPGAAAQDGDSPQLSVIAEALNVRSGPGISYPARDVLLQGEQVEIVGRHSASGWWQVRLDDETTGWVSGGAAYVQVSGDTSGVAAVSAPASPATGGSTPGKSGTLVFQTASGGAIYAVNADGSNLRYLTEGMDPALSPDGSQVAFTRWTDTQHGAFGSLWVTNLDGTGERVILDDVRQPKSPVWSPDGKQVAISMQQGGRLAPEAKCARELPSEPLLADEEGNYFRVKVEIEPDGEVEVKICYTLLAHPQWRLRTVNVATGASEDVPSDLYSYAPTWDPANDWHLVYDGEMGLVNLDINRDATWALTDDTHDHTPVFSPDGARIVVSYWQHDHWDIHVMNPDGSGRARLTETPLRVLVDQSIAGQESRSWNNVAATWSPDGSQIAFLTDRNGPWEIWVMNADGSNQRPLFATGTPNGLTIEYYNVGERALSWR
jgi:hypothetical protein